MRNDMRAGIAGTAMALVIGLLGTTQAAHAGFIITPVGATASSNIVGRPPGLTIDGSGLAFAVPAAITSAAKLPKHNEDTNSGGGFNGGMWLTNGGGQTGTITFDLGSVKTVDTLYVWNYAEVAFATSPSPTDSSNRGAKNVNILADNTANPTTFIQSLVFNKAVNTPLTSTNVSITPFFNDDFNTAVDTYVLSTPITARFIKFDITSNYGDPSFVGLSEVRFAVVPEPSILGAITVGFLMISRRRMIGRGSDRAAA